MANNDSKKKLGLFTATMLAIGTIIGSGILGTLPAAVSLAGKLCFICIFVAAVNVFFSNYVNMIVAGVIPVNGGPYVYLTRLVHPAFAITDMVQALCSAFLIALMGTIFGDYFSTVVPGANPTIVAIVVIAFFGVLNLFGVDVAAKAGNALVIMLFISFILFSFFGFTVDTATLPNYVPAAPKVLTFTMVGTVSAFFVSTLSGGSMLAYIAEDLKNPSKDIPLGFTISLLLVVGLYSVMSFATLRAAGNAEIDSLSTLAKQIMPGGAFFFFIFCGAFTAILSTINGMLIQNVAVLNKFADDKIFPSAFAKQNKYGVNYLNIIMMAGVPIFILIFKLDIFTLLSVSSVLAVFTTIIKLIPCLRVEKLYPNAYKKAYIHPKFWVMVLFVAIAAALNLFSGVSTIIETAGIIWIILLVICVLFGVYFFARNAYLKKNGENLWAILRAIPESWIEANKPE